MMQPITKNQQTSLVRQKITRETLDNSRLRSSQSGFTLVELLVVIFIIGILASLLLTNFVGVRGRATDATRKNDLSQLKTALRLYYNDYQQYPEGPDGVLMACGVDATSACTAGGEFSAGAGSTLYMKQLPASFGYYSDGGDDYLIVTELENASDEAINSSQTNCDPTSRSYFTDSLTAYTYVVCES